MFSAAIHSLFMPRCTSAIRRFVVAVGIDAIQRPVSTACPPFRISRPFAHISQKVQEALAAWFFPSFTNRYAASTPAIEVLGTRIITSPFHGSPDTVERMGIRHRRRLSGSNKRIAVTEPAPVVSRTPSLAPNGSFATIYATRLVRALRCSFFLIVGSAHIPRHAGTRAGFYGACLIRWVRSEETFASGILTGHLEASLSGVMEPDVCASRLP